MGERAGGVVLAGGRSSRMGRPKADLEWHGATLLFRTVAVVARAVAGPVVVVRAPGQELPALPDGVPAVEDPVEGLGPMQGIAAGLAHLRSRPGRVRLFHRPAVPAPRVRPGGAARTRRPGRRARAADEPAVHDPRLPLVAGDTVTFAAAD